MMAESRTHPRVAQSRKRSRARLRYSLSTNVYVKHSGYSEHPRSNQMFFQSHPFCVSLTSATFALLPNDLSGKLRRAERKGTRATEMLGQCALLTAEVRFPEDNRSTYTRLARERAYTRPDHSHSSITTDRHATHHISKILRSWPRRRDVVPIIGDKDR